MSHLLLDARKKSHRVHVVGGDWTPAAKVNPGEMFAIRTLDASGNQITEAIRTPAELDPDALFPATGHIQVNGVRRGDGVGIEVVDLQPVSTGHLWTRPGLGFGPAPDFHVRAVRTDDLLLDLGAHRLPLRARPHAGAIGVAPADPTPARDVGAYGGNIDTFHLRPGATLWLTAQQDGAGIFAADVHASIGDAEICGTGVEAEATLQLRVLHHDWAPPVPVVVDDGRVWVIGIGDNVESALETAVRFVHASVSDGLGVNHADAYLTVAALLQVEVCQVVNPHRSVAVSVGAGLDRHLVPPRCLAVGGDRL